MNKNYCVVQTKGGAGKTTISVNVLALMFKDNDIKINIFELDNNNTSKLANSKLNFQLGITRKLC
jgi:MinD-like ATPase involved in chromosome partitioning or flagellar assembly